MLRNLNQSSGGKRVLGTPKTGVLGSLIPATGDNGPGYAYNSLSLPADAGKEICGTITTWPASGSLHAYEDTSYEFSGAADGSYWFEWQLKVNGVATGSPVRAWLQVGPAYAGVTATADDAVFSGGATIAGVLASVSIAATTDDAVFAGGAAPGGSWSGSISDADVARIADAVMARLLAVAIPVNIKQVNDVSIKGIGTPANPWNPV